MPMEALKKSIESALHQAQLDCQVGDWAAVVTACEAAIAQCRQCLSNQTSDAQPGPNQAAAALHQAKGDLFKSQGELSAAIASYERALALSPKVASDLTVPERSDLQTALGEIYCQQAQSLQQSGHALAATQAYLKALRHQPRLFTAYSRLRYNLMRYDIPRGDPLLKEVVGTCQTILAQHPDISPARLTLGYAFTRLGMLSAAIDCYRALSDLTQRSRRLDRQHLDPQRLESAAARSPQRRAPDFIIIGAEKCGTTSLHQYLRQHPAVIPPIEKEIDFFDLEYSCGLDWYLAHFPASASSADALQTASSQTAWITGETSANYLYSDVAPARVFKHFPTIKLAVILRNPIDRTLSRYSMMVRNGAEKRSLKTAITAEITQIQQAITGEDIPWPILNRCRHVGNSLYYHHLKRWLALFSPAQLLVLKSEDLFARPQQTLQQFCHQLGLTADLPEQSYPQHNAGKYPSADADIRQQLADFFAPHNRQLETLLGQSFNWNIPTSPTDTAP
ncbi:MAG: sulfotransferase [Phormidesmis sp.]